MRRAGRRAASGAWLAAAALLAGCGGAPGPIDRVVFITLDTTRADRLGCYGFEQAATPTIDSLAAEGVLFEQAVSQVPTTLASHASMFTGLYPQDHGVRYNVVHRLGSGAVTLAEVLGQAGWATGAFPASYVLSRRFGLDQGFDDYLEPPSPPNYAALLEATPGEEPGLRQAEEIVDRASAWLEEQGDGPVFAWVHIYDPHWPYTPPFPWSDRFRDRPYDGEIAYADAQLARLLGQLRADPRWDRTLVVVAGDHGEGLYDHGERFHSWLIYETTQRVPLIIRTPGVGARRVARPVALVDLMPTVLELVGIEAPGDLRGVSLVPALSGEEPARRDLYFETLAGTLNYGWLELQGVRSGRWKLIDAGAPELYDLEADPGERTNLASLERERVEELRAVLRRTAEPLEQAGGEAEPAHGPVLDADTEAFLASLGYVGGGGDATSAPGAAHPRDMVDLEGELMQAQVAAAAQRWDLVVELCRYVLTRDPANRWALYSGASALLALSSPREAQDLAAEMLRLYPTDESSYTLLARTYREQDRMADAWRVLRQGREALPESPLLEYQSLLAGFEVGDPEVCASGVTQALEHQPDSEPLTLLRARCEAARGEHAAAIASLERAVELGFRELHRLGEAEEFDELSGRPEFRALLERVGQGRAGTGPQG